MQDASFQMEERLPSPHEKLLTIAKRRYFEMARRDARRVCVTNLTALELHYLMLHKTIDRDIQHAVPSAVVGFDNVPDRSLLGELAVILVQNGQQRK